jgi:hypothetical protein
LSTLPAILSPIMACACPRFSVVTVLLISGHWLGPRSLRTGSSRSLDLRSRLRACPARSPVTAHRIEFTSGSSRSPLRYGLAVRFQLLSTDGLRRRSFFPLQAG